MVENQRGASAATRPVSAATTAPDVDRSVASDMKEEAMAAAGDVKDEVAGAAVALKEQASSEISSLTGQTRQEATHLVQEARDTVTSQADTATRQLASTIADAGHELAQMAEHSDQPDGPATQLVRQLATRTEAVADRLERDGYQGVAADITRFGRNRPGLFLLAAGITGFAVGRLLRNTDTGAIAEAVKDEPAAAPAGMPDRPMAEAVDAGAPAPALVGMSGRPASNGGMR